MGEILRWRIGKNWGAVGQGGCLIGGGCESHNAMPTIAGQGTLPVMFVKSRIPSGVFSMDPEIAPLH